MLQTHKYPLRFSKLLLQHCNVRNGRNIADDETITHLATRRIRERNAGGRGNCHFGLDSAEVQRGNAHSAYGNNAVGEKSMSRSLSKIPPVVSHGTRNRGNG